MFAFQLLRMVFSYFMQLAGQMALVRSPAIGVRAPDPKRHEQHLQFEKRPIFPPPKHIGQDFPGAMIQCMP